MPEGCLQQDQGLMLGQFQVPLRTIFDNSRPDDRQTMTMGACDVVITECYHRQLVAVSMIRN